MNRDVRMKVMVVIRYKLESPLGVLGEPCPSGLGRGL